jgi:phosphoadenosine phosphosulfate reductase
MELAEFMNRHDRVVLQFSAGKDSAACLKLLRPFLSKVEVIWANPGDPYPEVVEYMSHIRSSVPHFTEATGSVKRFISEWGYPADAAPFEGSALGRLASGNKIKIIPLNQCCAHNMWGPMWEATKRAKVTGVIRGQKESDPLKAPLGGFVKVGDYEYFMPLHNWTDAQVFEYLGDEVPQSYKRGLKTSLDCKSCTAYAGHNPGRLVDLAIVDPKTYDEIKPVVDWLTDRARENLDNLQRM